MKPMVLLTAILLIAGTILAAGCVQQPAGPPATATPTTAQQPRFARLFRIRDRTPDPVAADTNPFF
jgi:hypothetical protein